MHFFIFLFRQQSKNDERPLPALNNRKSQGLIEEQENENDLHNETGLLALVYCSPLCVNVSLIIEDKI